MMTYDDDEYWEDNDYDEKDNAEQAKIMLLFIKDVKVCNQCNTKDLSKVIYCPVHKAALKKVL